MHRFAVVVISAFLWLVVMPLAAHGVPVTYDITLGTFDAFQLTDQNGDSTACQVGTQGNCLTQSITLSGSLVYDDETGHILGLQYVLSGSAVVDFSGDLWNGIQQLDFFGLGYASSGASVTTLFGFETQLGQFTSTLAVLGSDGSTLVVPDHTFDAPGVAALVLVNPAGGLDIHLAGANVGVLCDPRDPTTCASVSANFDITAAVAALELGYTTPDGTTTDQPSILLTGFVNQVGAAVDVNGVAAAVLDMTWSATVPLAAGSNAMVATASLGTEVATSQIVVVQFATPPLPPAAPTPTPVDQTVVTSVADSVAFLYADGQNPVQTGVDATQLDASRAVVLRGLVTNRGRIPLASVRILVEGHPEFGETLSRTDGMFDMVANGGETLTVRYERPGFLTVQRQVRTAWQGFAFLPDVVMTPLDPVLSPVVLQPGAGTQVARATLQSDADGSRTATMLFAGGTSAEMVLPSGTVQPLASFGLRMTEYTVGDAGPGAMPGMLPPSSAYTYAVGLDVQEALDAGAEVVRFNQPVPFYVENFLGLPTGLRVPVGLYSKTAAAWEPSDDGRVVEILSEAAGVAVLDVDGSGLPADAAALASLGITTAELTEVASLYQPGDTLWRAAVLHFSTMDLNLPPSFPVGAEPWLGDSGQNQTKPPNNPDCQTGSVIECQNQVLRERIAITGSPYTLNYSSQRAPGRAAARMLRINLSDATPPAPLRRIDLEVKVAGQRFRQSFPPVPNQVFEYTWDGLDAYGRAPQGSVSADVEITYVYDAVYQVPSPGAGPFFRSFARPGLLNLPGRGRAELTLTRGYRARVGAFDARGFGLGGWSLSPHHAYDPVERVLYRGDGTRRSAQDISRTVRLFAGTGAIGTAGDGGPAASATLSRPGPLAVGPDGSVYFR